MALTAAASPMDPADPAGVDPFGHPRAESLRLQFTIHYSQRRPAITNELFARQVHSLVVEPAKSASARPSIKLTILIYTTRSINCKRKMKETESFVSRG